MDKFKIGDFVKIKSGYYDGRCGEIFSVARTATFNEKIYYLVLDAESDFTRTLAVFESEMDLLVEDWGDGE